MIIWNEIKVIFWLICDDAASHTSLKRLNSSDIDEVPCMVSEIIVFASVLELPGFPTRNKGILNSMHTTNINAFSFKALLRAMLFPSFI